MRVCDIWADSINITSVLYQFSSASSMRPDIAHRLACCDNLSSRPVHGGGEGYMCTDRDVSFSSFPSLRNEWMSASLSKIKSFPPVIKCSEIYLSIEIHWIRFDFLFSLKTKRPLLNFLNFINVRNKIILSWRSIRLFFLCKIKLNRWYVKRDRFSFICYYVTAFVCKNFQIFLTIFLAKVACT